MTDNKKEAGKDKKPAHHNLQDEFLGGLIAQQIPVSCFLVNGIRLQGMIVSMDVYTVMISSVKGGAAQLVYKAAISTVVPDRPVVMPMRTPPEKIVAQAQS